MSAAQANDAEKNIEIWKVKKLIKRLEEARGNGTSMISLIIRTVTSDHTIQLRRNKVQLPKIKCLVRLRCWLKVPLSQNNPSLLWSDLLSRIWHCIQHQVSSQPSFCSVGHYFYPTAPQALLQSSP